MSCKKYKNYLNAFLDGEVTSAEKEDIETHIKSCSLCAESLNELKGIKMLLKAKAPRWEAGNELEQRIRSRLAEESSDGFRFKSFISSFVFTPKRLVPVVTVIVALVLAFAVFWDHPTVYADPTFQDAISRHKAYCSGESKIGKASSDPKEVTQWFKDTDKLPRDVVVPISKDPELILEGGCKCMIGGTPIARLQYKLNELNLTFIESPLGSEIANELRSKTDNGVKYWYFTEKNCTTIYWENHRYGYYLVAFEKPEKVIELAKKFYLP